MTSLTGQHLISHLDVNCAKERLVSNAVYSENLYLLFCGQCYKTVYDAFSRLCMLYAITWVILIKNG